MLVFVLFVLTSPTPTSKSLMPSKISKGKASEAVESQFPMPEVFLMKIGCSHTVASGDNEVELEDARKSAAL